MKKNLIVAIVTALSILIFSSCASIVSKSVYPVSFNSDPVSTVIIYNRAGQQVFFGKTPATVDLKSSSGFFVPAKYHIKFICDNGVRKETQITAYLNSWYAANIFFGGLIGMLIVDPATGAMWRINDRNIHENLEPDASGSTLQVVDVNTLTEEQKSVMVRIN